MKKISDVMWEAANLYLCFPSEPVSDKKFYYSCDAISAACNDDYYHYYDTIYHAFANYLGCGQGYTEFNEFSTAVKQQEARYNWLMFCYEYAKELGC